MLWPLKVQLKGVFTYFLNSKTIQFLNALAPMAAPPFGLH